MEEFFKLLQSILEDLPEGTDESIKKNGATVRVMNKDGVKGYSFMYSNETYDDSATIEKIASYKDIIENLSDCFFLNFCEELEEDVDIQRMSELMDKEHLTKDEAEEVESYLAEAKDLLIANLIEERDNLDTLMNTIERVL